MIMKPKNVDLETILAPLGRPSEAMLAVLGGLWRPRRASWRQLEPTKSNLEPSRSQLGVEVEVGVGVEVKVGVGVGVRNPSGWL